MTRMTNDIAVTITKQIIAYSHDKPLADAKAKAEALADAFHAALYNSHAKPMNSLPKGAFDWSNALTIYTLLGRKHVQFSTQKPIFHAHRNSENGFRLVDTRLEAETKNNPIMVAAHDALDAVEALKTLKDERSKKYDRLLAQIRAFTTLKNLVAALPTTEPFLYGIENNVVKLPVVQVAEFNASFGLPADPKLIKATVQAHTGA